MTELEEARLRRIIAEVVAEVVTPMFSEFRREFRTELLTEIRTEIQELRWELIERMVQTDKENLERFQLIGRTLEQHQATLTTLVNFMNSFDKGNGRHD